MTPAAKASAWSGNLAATTEPSGATGQGSFSYALTYVDKNSWIASGTEIKPGLNATGTCTYSVVNELVRTGK
jgi:hypothetical protein